MTLEIYIFALQSCQQCISNTLRFRVHFRCSISGSTVFILKLQFTVNHLLKQMQGSPDTYLRNKRNMYSCVRLN